MLSLQELVNQSIGRNHSEYVNFELNLQSYRNKNDQLIPKKRRIGIEVLKTQGQPQDNELMIFFKPIHDDNSFSGDHLSDVSIEPTRQVQLLNQIVNDIKMQFQILFMNQKDILRLLECNSKENIFHQLQSIITNISEYSIS